MKNLTLRYSLTQFAYWATVAGTSSFATTFLLGLGMPSQVVGILLAAAGLLSCLTQPMLAGIADRSRKFVLNQMLIALSGVCILCISAQMIPGLPVLLAGILYAIGIWASDSMLPLLNALSISYPDAGYPINFGAARSIGSIATGSAALVVGFIIARWGTLWMLLLVIALRFVCILALCSFPKISKLQPAASANTANASCSILQFLQRYKWYCASLFGLMLLGMFHTMTENYLIAIVGRLGGNSSHVGTTLFIAAYATVPVIFCFSTIRKFLPEQHLLKIVAISYLLKAILYYFASSITAIYLLQLFQLTTYALLAPSQVYYAQAKVHSADMVKGQAFSTALYALGCSAGNFAGGQLLSIGVESLFIAGIIVAAIGAVIVFLTVHRTDRYTLEHR